MNCFLGLILLVFPVLKNGLWGFIDQNGKKVLDTHYDYISSPNNNFYFVVAQGNNFGLVDSTGKEVLPLVNKSVHFFYDSLIVVEKDSNFYLLDADFKSLLSEPIKKILNISPYSVHHAENFDGVYSYTLSNGKVGFISRKKVLLPEYDGFEILNNKYFMLKKDGKWTITDLYFYSVYPKYFDEIESLGGYYILKQNQKFGLLKKNFSFLLKPEYYEMNHATFFEKTYVVYKKSNSNSIAIFDLETEKELFDLPFSAVSELENGDLVDNVNGFPRYVQVTLNGKVGVYDLVARQLAVTPSYSALGYLNHDRFVVYDNYSKFKVLYNNKVISKDTILGFVHPFDSIPVTYFYKDVLDQNNKVKRYFGAFNLDGDLLVPFPVSSMVLHKNKITFINAKGSKSVVKFDEKGHFEEYIDNYQTIVIHDTNRRESVRRNLVKCSNFAIDYSVNYQFVDFITELLYDGISRRLFMRKIFSRVNNDCAMGGLVCIDAHLDNLNQLGIAPFLSKDYFYKILDMNHKRTIDAFSIQPDGKGVKKKFSFASEFADGMAALDFTNPESGLSDRIEKNVKFFNVFGSVRHFYSDGHISGNHTYQNGSWGFVDSTGKLAILPKFSRVQLFNKGVAIVEAGRKWALIDKKGALASPRYYNDIERMKNDTLFLVKDFFGGLGFFDKRFDTKLPARVRGKVEAPGYNIYPVQCKNKKWAYRHFNGTWLTDSIYAHAKPFTDGLAAFCKDELWGYIDTNGVVVIKPIYAEAKSMHCKSAFVKLPNKEEYMLINDKGLRVGKMSFKEVMAFEQDLAIVYKDGFWGVIDQTGEWVYANEFSSIDPFNLHGEAKAVKAGKTYIISSEKSIKPFDKKEMTYFKVPKQLSEKEIDEYNILIMRKMKGVSLNIDKKLYHKNSIAETEYLPFLQPNKYGLISRTGKIYLPVEYQFVEQYTSDIFKVYFDNEIGYFSVKKGWLYKPWL